MGDCVDARIDRELVLYAHVPPLSIDCCCDWGWRPLSVEDFATDWTMVCANATRKLCVEASDPRAGPPSTSPSPLLINIPIDWARPNPWARSGRAGSGAPVPPDALAVST